MIHRAHYLYIDDCCKGNLTYKKSITISELLINMFKYVPHLPLAQNAAITPNVIYT